MSNPDPHKCRLERTHSASFCTKNHQNPFINKKVPLITLFPSQNLGITSLTRVSARQVVLGIVLGSIIVGGMRHSLRFRGSGGVGDWSRQALFRGQRSGDGPRHGEIGAPPRIHPRVLTCIMEASSASGWLDRLSRCHSSSPTGPPCRCAAGSSNKCLNKKY